MQTYALKMHNFLRFGEINNSIVFDLSHEQRMSIKDGTTTMDNIYEKLKKDPLNHVRQAKIRGITSPIGIKGIVDNDPNMSNGAGKSSILEAICYVRYDRIIRKTANTDKIEKAGTSVVRRVNGAYPSNLKESYVEEFFESDGCIYRIKRGRTFTKGHKNNTPILEFECIGADKVDSLSSHRSADTKKSIEEVITMDYDLFVNSQMFGQNDAGKILIGTDKVRKEMLISLLQVENVVQGCLENVRKKKNDQQKIVDGIRSNIAILEKNIFDLLKFYSLDSVNLQSFSIDFCDKLLKIIESKKQEAEKAIIEIKAKMVAFDNSIESLSKSENIVTVEKIMEEGRGIKGERDSKEKAKNEQLEEWKKIQQENVTLYDQKKSDRTKKQSKLNELKIKMFEKNKLILDFKKEELELLLKKCQSAKALKPETTKKLEETKKSVNDGIAKISEIQTIIRQKSTDIEKLQKQIKSIKGEIFVCTECKSNVNRKHVVDKISDFKKEMENLESKLKEFLPLHEQYVKLSAELESKLQKIVQYTLKEGEILSKFKEHEENVKHIDELKIMVSDAEESIKVIDKEIIALENKYSEYDTKCKNIEKNFAGDIEILNKRLAECSKRYKDAKSNAEIVFKEIAKFKMEKVSFEHHWSMLSKRVGELAKELEYQTKQKNDLLEKNDELSKSTKHLNRLLFLEDIYGLDGVQTRIIKKYLPLLNVYTKEFLDIQSHGKMAVKFEINDKSKVDLKISGETADSFDLLSGGEKMTTRLAVDIALTLLSFSRSSQKPEMISLDEIFGPLDASHISGVFRVLKKLEDKFDRVIIISHRSEIQDLTKNNIVVEKDSSDNGISIIRGFED